METAQTVALPWPSQLFSFSQVLAECAILQACDFRSRLIEISSLKVSSLNFEFPELKTCRGLESLLHL